MSFPSNSASPGRDSLSELLLASAEPVATTISTATAPTAARLR